MALDFERSGLRLFISVHGGLPTIVSDIPQNPTRIIRRPPVRINSREEWAK